MKKPWVLALFLLAARLEAGEAYYAYTIGEFFGRGLYAMTLNSKEYRMLPNGFYEWEENPNDTINTFRHTLTSGDPGPYLYASRAIPSKIYGYRRLIDGQLEPLPGFPLALEPDNESEVGTIWMERHPHLPIVYLCNTFNDTIQAFRIEGDGSWQEIAGSPFLLPVFYAPQNIKFNRKGTRAYISLFNTRGLCGYDVDPNTGALSNLRTWPGLVSIARGLVLSEDERFLYVKPFAVQGITAIKINGDQLEPLSFTPMPSTLDTIWLFRKGNKILAGDFLYAGVAVWIIQEDGTLVLGPNSPLDIRGAQMFYTDFAARGNKVFYSGNLFQNVFDLSPDGSLQHNELVAVIHNATGGMSLAPEFHGDPYQLRFEYDQELHPRAVVGEPFTSFYLRQIDSCTGPFQTDQTGVWSDPSLLNGETAQRIVAYCDSESTIDGFWPVPALQTPAHWFLILGLASLAVVQMQKSKNGARS